MPSKRRHPTPAVLLALAAWTGGCAPGPAAPPAIPAVFVSPVHNTAGVERQVFSGQWRPRIETELGFRAGGKVAQRLVELGQVVQAGQPLAMVDPTDYRLALQSATEQLRAADTDAAQAASDAARFQRLLADGSVGAADAERQQARADAAAARLAQTRAQEALARNRLGYTTLTAPFSGVVTAVRFERGQVVTEGQPVLVLAQADTLEVVVDVPESLAPALAGWQAEAEVGSARVPLRLRELAPAASPLSRTSRARFALQQGADPATLRIGATTRVVLRQPAAGLGVELPSSALIATGQGPDDLAVWVVQDGADTLERRPVRLLSQTTGHVRLAGLRDGEQVVTVGVQKLDAGMVVRPVPRAVEHQAAIGATP